MDDDYNNIVPKVKVPSLKETLLNLDSKGTDDEQDDITLKQGDVSIGLNGNIPTVDFVEHVKETLNRKMGMVVVIKLLGRKIGYRQLRTQFQNIWKPSGHFKLTDMDEDCFLVRFQDDLDYQNAILTGPVMGWIRLPKLPARYYHKSVIRSIGSVFGEVIRVDYNTDSGDRGKFARIVVVCIDLTKPLTSKILVDGELISVEYEGLPTICFSCGKYGHLQEACPAKLASTSGEVQRRRRFPVRGDKANEAKGNTKVVSALRYEILSELQEDEVPREHVLVEEGHFTKVDNRKKKRFRVKGPKEADHRNQDKRESDGSGKYFGRILAKAQLRTPRRTIEPHVPLLGPNGGASSKATSLHGNDPISTSRGLKLSSGVTIHKLGSKPIPDKIGPSTNLLKQTTKDLQGKLLVSREASGSFGHQSYLCKSLDEGIAGDDGRKGKITPQEDLIFNHLKKFYPTHKFIGEETTAALGATELTDEPTWIVDPLDGTTNFVHGFPFVCVSIGITIQKVPTVGVVYNPILNELFTAIHGRGAFLMESL
ncbi:hypothetical protein K1719_038177 [Acacia pycnantha]|nr:hypothetical protein K1719_038177 [Acacia pycnantha]